ncbi:hypothetical protein GOPIP_011_01620 [Gordonia polyisoprenivorans NBRC 16320 = JCM 10675]|uniref:Beta-ketoacyl synthase n=1 Tax=Gordonia polyisoprenivorans TaxID=84595 RepID=A0A846WNU2_9ACTN|nr:beta-ketoacyl synthase [Gordonia polyisoprenivorans]NKY03282.1 beta-ketoacyl synthase [Gordonia polyisoprenivorans]WCB36335.1 beta-ketoacyl synthase [Gordonia polyisoprenivorans]GAB21770.1 hypothetical protein GOPIP_011_01620 [Gordonia polyisoprenivorans NBRC 16320 = JCM 10675]
MTTFDETTFDETTLHETTLHETTVDQTGFDDTTFDDDAAFDLIAFDGPVFDPFAGGSPQAPRDDESVEPVSTRIAPIPAARTGPAGGAGPVGAPGPMTGSVADLAAGVLSAHRAALRAQTALQRALVDRALSGNRFSRSASEPAAPASGDTHGSGGNHRAGALTSAPEGAFKPLTRPSATTLRPAELPALLARAGYPGPVAVDVVTDISVRGGSRGLGALSATPARGAAPQDAVKVAAVIFAALVGLPDCLPNPTAHVALRSSHDLPAGPFRLEIREIDLLPRPHLVAEVVAADAGVTDAGVTYAGVTDNGVAQDDHGQVEVLLREGPGTHVGPRAGGGAPSPSARTSRDGRHVLLNEFHMAHLSRGDQALALGPEFGVYTGRRATRLPTGGLLLVDRVVDYSGNENSRKTAEFGPAAYNTEYDAPADSWYFADTANESMPHFVFMETSLQAALLMGYYAGPTLVDPHATASLRNLGGTATLHRQLDLRDKTICQHSRLLSTTILPGSSLQTFDYTLSVEGETLYSGETLFGYFSDEALATQTGLDAGATRPSWIAAQQIRPRTRRIDVAARRGATDRMPRSVGKLALLDWVDVVDGGGEFGLGCLHLIRPIDPHDWYFERHFHLDPVIPGSLGVETVVQAVQEWMIDAGHGSDYAEPGFAIPTGVAFGWKYRGQFLPSDEHCEVEVHIKSVHVGEHAVVVVVDASLWKPGLRIYELTDLGIELHDRKAIQR